MAARDPLLDTLFRPTEVVAELASAPPLREAGTRTRAGNAMGRTRAALMSGAARAVQANGTKITMSQVASASGVAKATLYNHFRTRDAVLAGLVEHEVAALVSALGSRPLPDALAGAARALSEHPVLRALRRVEPAVLARLAAHDPAARGWQLARDAVAAALVRDGRAGTDFVLRWLASFVVSPADPAGVDADVAVLVAGLPGRPGDAAVEHAQAARTA